jgi:hypothetical protein
LRDEIWQGETAAVGIDLLPKNKQALVSASACCNPDFINILTAHPAR